MSHASSAGRVLVLAILAWLAVPVAILAQQTGGDVAPASPPAASAVRAASPPTLDGDILGDPAYANAPIIDGFWQEQPNEGQPGSERTEVRMVYTEDALWVGVVLYDRQPGEIIVSDSRRDASLDNTDSFSMIFDTYRDRQSGFVFGTNPAGIEYDGQVTNEGQGGGGLAGGQNQMGGSGGGFNLNWDGSWQVRTRIDERGWTAEFAIPFRTLRYPGAAEQSWGVNFHRIIRRRNERSYWAPIPRQYNLYRVSLAGTVGGIEAPAFKNFKITPYALGNSITSGVRPVDTEYVGDVGGDLKYNLTPSLTLDATVNTDFAQVEVDEQQVNLDRFSVFFPEKRPFFLENAGFFSVGNPGEVDLFFSRRIGIGDDGASIPILAGGRVSGKAGNFNVGVLNMQTGSEDPTPSNNFGVVRVSRDLPNRSSIGALVVNRQGMGDLAEDDDYNRTFALDGRVGIGQNTVLSGFLAATSTPGVDGDDHAFNLRSRTTTSKVDFDLGYQEVADDFNPEVGFLNRRGYRKPDVRVFTRFRPDNPFGIQEIRPHVSWRGFWGFDDFQESGFAHIDSHWQFRNAYEIHTGMNLTLEGVRSPFEIFPGVFVPPGTYEHAEAQLVFMTDQGAPASLNLQTFFGGFFGGDRVTLNPTIRFRLGEALTTQVSYSRNDVNLEWGDFVTNLIRTRVSYSFNPNTFVQGLVQYNDRADSWSMNLRLGWLQSANTGLFIVYNDTRGLYDLFDTPERTDRSLTIKYSRMFDIIR